MKLNDVVNLYSTPVLRLLVRILFFFLETICLLLLHQMLKTILGYLKIYILQNMSVASSRQIWSAGHQRRPKYHKWLLEALTDKVFVKLLPKVKCLSLKFNETGHYFAYKISFETVLEAK